MSYSEKPTFGHESKKVEFKSSFLVPSKGCVEEQPFVVFKAVCAMLNTDGGVVYIGVRDSGEFANGTYYGVSGDIKRLNNKHITNADGFSRHIRNEIDCFFHNSEYVRGIVDAYEDNEHDNVILITVGRANRMVYMHHRGNDHERIAFRREGAASNLMTSAMIKQREAELRKEKAMEKDSLHHDDIHTALQKAIDNKRKVVLYNYSSSNSDQVKDKRIIEPIEFICNGRGIWGYEERDDDREPLRQFKLCRIKNIKVLDEPCTHENEYKKAEVDAFEWSRWTKASIHIEIQLGPSARNQLVEDCPESQKYIKECGDQWWELDTYVHSLEPVKKFCQSFKDSINIIVPDELKRELGLIADENDVEIKEEIKEENEEPTSVFKAAMGILKKAFAEIRALKKISKKSNN
ncbi:MAG: WYL domain-containing protein [Bacteroidales bacterium]|nr:WYL domain-containing protein [Bacteroidales bacterium]